MRKTKLQSVFRWFLAVMVTLTLMPSVAFADEGETSALVNMPAGEEAAELVSATIPTTPVSDQQTEVLHEADEETDAVADADVEAIGTEDAALDDPVIEGEDDVAESGEEDAADVEATEEEPAESEPARDEDAYDPNELVQTPLGMLTRAEVEEAAALRDAEWAAMLECFNTGARSRYAFFSARSLPNWNYTGTAYCTFRNN